MKLFAYSTTVSLLLLFAPVATRSAAGPLGSDIPGNCVEHTTFNDGPDAIGDYRCAGQEIQFHTAGVANSPYSIWAGQWLFRDPAGSFRVGSCTFNRGIHPTINSSARWVGQSLPNDPTGVLSSYLAWKYGDTTDNLTAAALWAVFHYYAQDDAGPNRASNANDPLVPTLGVIEAASGRSDLQSRAFALHHEAEAVAEEWTLALAVAADGTATVTLSSGANPVPDQPISVLVSGLDVPLVTITSADGTATVTVSLPPGTVTVVATASAPGPADVYRGEPAFADGQGGQNLITGGASRLLRAEASIDVVAATTTTETVTTTAAPTTVVSTTEPATTEPATVDPSTTEIDPSTTYVGVDSTALDPTTTEVPGFLPRTGDERDTPVAYVGTAFLVGGVGLLGTLRRRRVVS
ncbi:MAG: Ig-like domain-containing protein [Actinomycetia bacterium]|nr:Ig-like domain-containing protein [Actinomycetes bacterium]